MIKYKQTIAEINRVLYICNDYKNEVIVIIVIINLLLITKRKIV